MVDYFFTDINTPPRIEILEIAILKVNGSWMKRIPPSVAMGGTSSWRMAA